VVRPAMNINTTECVHPQVTVPCGTACDEHQHNRVCSSSSKSTVWYGLQ